MTRHYPTTAQYRQNERDADAEVAFQQRVAGVILGAYDEANLCPLCYGPHEVKDCPCAKTKEARRGSER